MPSKAKRAPKTQATQAATTPALGPSICSLINPALGLPARGLVEIVDIYGGNYFHLYVDGELTESVQKGSFEPTALSRRFIKEAKKISGVGEEELTFAYIDWDSYGERLMGDFDSNDFEEYESYIQALGGHPPIAAKSYECKIMAVGITRLEEHLL